MDMMKGKKGKKRKEERKKKNLIEDSIRKRTKEEGWVGKEIEFKKAAEEDYKELQKEFEKEELLDSNIAWARAVDKKLDARDKEIVEKGEDKLV